MGPKSVAMQCNTLYRAQGVVVDAPGDRKRAAAYAELQDVVRAQLGVAEVENRLKLGAFVDVIVAVDAPVLWHITRNVSSTWWFTGENKSGQGSPAFISSSNPSMSCEGFRWGASSMIS